MPVVTASTKPSQCVMADSGAIVDPEIQVETAGDTAAAGCPHGNGRFCEVGTDKGARSGLGTVSRTAADERPRLVATATREPETYPTTKEWCRILEPCNEKRL